MLFSTFLLGREVSFEDLPKLAVGEEITIKGFISKNEEGATILAPVPNLKSCCLASHPHLTLDKTIESPFYQVVTVTGRISNDKILKVMQSQ